MLAVPAGRSPPTWRSLHGRASGFGTSWVSSPPLQTVSTMAREVFLTGPLLAGALPSRGTGIASVSTSASSSLRILAIFRPCVASTT
eukprot:3304174-Heterocapsa_arctica.AAC.1